MQGIGCNAQWFLQLLCTKEQQTGGSSASGNAGLGQSDCQEFEVQLRQSSDEEGIECIGISGQSPQGKKVDERSQCQGAAAQEVQGDDQQQPQAAGV